MIKIEKIQVSGFEPAIRGMRNPMNSWHLSDSMWCQNLSDGRDEYVVGEKDLNLMKRLYQGGSVHRKYLRQIQVWMDITAPLYWWKEFDTYKVGTTADSTSTMHKIHTKPFEINDFSYEHLEAKAILNLKNTIIVLNDYRWSFNKTDDKKYWWQMIQLLPSSYNQKRTVCMSYENVMQMIYWRENHKLDEWREFCGVLKALPYVKQIISKD